MTKAIPYLARSRSEVVVLVGEDAAYLGRLSGVLEAAGFDVQTKVTSRGETPVIATPPDVACLDLGPGNAGVRLAKQLHEALPGVPIITLVGERPAPLQADVYEEVARADGEARITAAVRRAAERRYLADAVRRMTREIAELRQLLEPGRAALPYNAMAADGEADRIDDFDRVVPIRELERREILKALTHTKGSVAAAARKLGIGRATLYRRLSELNLPPPTVALRAITAPVPAPPVPPNVQRMKRV